MNYSNQETYSFNKTIAVCLVIIAAVAITVALIYTKPVLIPLTIAIFISSFISAGVNKIACRIKLPQWCYVFLGIFISVSLFLCFAFIIYYSIVMFSQHIESYRDSFAKLNQTFKLYLSDLNINTELLTWEVENLPLVKYAQSFTGMIFNLAGHFVLVVVFSLFLITGSLLQKGKRSSLFLEINEKLSSYAGCKFLMSILTGTVVALILFGFNVNLAIIFGLITVVLNFVPTIGAIVATLIPLPIFNFTIWTGA